MGFAWVAPGVALGVAVMGKTRRHISISIRGAIGLPDSELKTWIGNLYDDKTGEPVRSVREIRLALAEALAEGCEYIRNQECDNFDPERGCLGHPVEEGNVRDADGK